jgi:RNA polymerase sigma factor for flagellar operon FliA
VLAEIDLVAQGLPLVLEVSKRIARRLGGHLTVDDLTGIGNLALVEVVRGYDPARASFVAYAAARLKYMILDGVRRETHGRAMAARVAAVMASERFGDAPPEVPSRDGPTTVEEDQAALGDLLSGHAAALAFGLLSSPPDPELVPDATRTPEEQFERAQTVQRVQATIGELPERERSLIERHYYGGEPFDLIARDLGISKSRASRVHQRAIVAVRHAVREPDELRQPGF